MTSDQCCDMMRYAIATDDIPPSYEPRFRLWDIEQQDGLGTRWQIRYCPWSGHDLGEGLGEQWLEEVKRRGLDPTADVEDLPADLRDDRWWKSIG